MDSEDRKPHEEFYEVFLYDATHRWTGRYITVNPGEEFMIPVGYGYGELMMEFPRAGYAEFAYRLLSGVTYSVDGCKIIKNRPGEVEVTEFFPEPCHAKGCGAVVRFSVERIVGHETVVSDAKDLKWGYADMYGDIVIPAE